MFSKQNDCNLSSVSKLVKPLTVSKPVCSTIVSKSNICNASIVNQHVQPLNVSKSMSSCNVRNRNVHIVNSISHHTKPLSVVKSECSRNKFLNYDRFIYHDVNIFNISHTNILSSSDLCHPFSFYFCKYSFF